MALTLDHCRSLNEVVLIAKRDDAIDLGKSDYEKFLETGNEDHLAFVEGKNPTRFILNFDFKGRDGEKIKNAMMGTARDGQPNVAMGSWSYLVTKHALKEIRYGEGVPLEKQIKMQHDQHQNVHDDLIARLDKLGVVAQIFSLYMSLVQTPERAEAKNS